MTRSIESRFLAIVAITVFILVVPLFALFLTLASNRAAKELQDHVDILLSTNSQALAKPMWDFDREGVEQIAATIITANAVTKVQVRDASGGINVSMPPLPVWPKSGVESKSREIFYDGVEGRKPVGTITIYYSRFDAWSSLRDAEALLISIFLVAVLGEIGRASCRERV